MSTDARRRSVRGGLPGRRHESAPVPTLLPTNRLVFFVVAGLVAVSRIPFLYAGYGNDWDCWRVANAARYIAETGDYAYSRVPGHPLQEIAFSTVWSGGPLALNGITAAASVLATLLLTRYLQRRGSKDVVLTSLAFAFTPVVFINSTESQDYMLALALLMGALTAADAQRPVLAGILVGAATGCRVTSIVMGMPLGLLFLGRPFGWRCAMTFGLAAGLTSFVMYVPVMLTYGPFFFGHTGTPHVPLSGIIKIATIDVWGVPGLAGLMAAVAALAFWGLPPETSISTAPREHVWMWCATVLVCAAVYLAYALNYKPGFLIPAVPFALVLLARFLYRPVFRIVCWAVILSPFVLGVVTASLIKTYGGSRFFVVTPLALEARVMNDTVFLDLLNGPLTMNHARRVRSTEYIASVLARAREITAPSLVVAGDWVQLVRAVTGGTMVANVTFVETVSEEVLRSQAAKGTDLYYLEGWRVFGFENATIDMTRLGAKPLEAR